VVKPRLTVGRAVLRLHPARSRQMPEPSPLLSSGVAGPHVRDVTLGEDAATSRTGRGPANLTTIRAAIAAIKHAGYLHVPEGRRDDTTPAETLHLHSLD
jgi:hypothetical protein